MTRATPRKQSPRDRGDVRAVSRSRDAIIRYELPGAWTVLAGASDADNDRLSTELASPQDWWFHAADVPGSHVILRSRAGESPSRETLRQAAAIAAYHSRARSAKTARVTWTRARYVRKPGGARAGTVEVTGGRVLRVRPDISFATRLPLGTGSTIE